MSIRIMHVVNNLGKGGLENGLVNLIRRMDPCRFEHVVCTIRGLGPNVERLPLDRVHVVDVGAAAGSERLQTPALLRTMRRFRPQVVHSRNWGAIEAVIAGRLARVDAVIHSEHGFEAKASIEEPARRVWFRRVAYELADRVVTVSYQLRDLHAARTGFSARRISVIHNGVDRATFRADPDCRARTRQTLGIADSEFCLGCVANLVPVKDHMSLLESLTVLEQRTDKWRLLLVGEGPERTRLEAFVNSRPGWRQRVLFLGSTSRVPELLQAMDVFVLPSLAEGICNSLLEAMATGLPVVAADVGGNPEVITDGESGLLFPSGKVADLAQRLVELWAEPPLRRRLGARGCARVRDEFSIDAMVQQYEHLYAGFSTAELPALSAEV